MDKAEIVRQLNEAKRKLNNYLDKKSSTQKKIKKHTDGIEDLRRTRKKVESQLDEIYNSIVKKANRLHKNSKLRDAYLRDAKNVIKGNKSSRALINIDNGISKAKKEILTFEDEIDFYNTKIQYYERKIEELKQKLNEVK